MTGCSLKPCGPSTTRRVSRRCLCVNWRLWSPVAGDTKTTRSPSSVLHVTEPLAMEFLWYPYIIRYGITLLVGDPGRGKSLFAEYIAALVSSGGQLPLSDERLEPGRVLLLSAENDWARTTLERLKKAGANIDNFHVMDR